LDNAVDSFYIGPPWDTLIYAPLTDIEGNPRPSGEGFDMGAYEGSYERIIDYYNKPVNITLSVFPNPFNSSVRISFDCHSREGGNPAGGGVKIEIYDIAGKRVFTEFVGAGLKPARAGGSETLPYETVWRPAPSVPSGVYLVRAKIGDNEITRKAVYLK
jgi:hypothetical protein